MRIRGLSSRIYRLDGFTLLELLITGAVIGLFSAMFIVVSTKSLNRSRVNAVALELAGWLQRIQNASLASTYCRVIFNPHGTAATVAASQTFSPGDTIFSVEPTSCLPSQPNFSLPDSAGSARFTVWSNPEFQFTQRGNVVQTTNNDIKIFMVNTQYLRCVRTFPAIGLFRIGSNSNAAAVTEICSASSFSRF